MMRKENMYESLRMVNDGGLPDKINMIKQADNTITLCIGIGGTGINALKNIKKAVYKTIRPDNYDKPDSDKPEYKHIKFLAIDADAFSVRGDSPSTDLSTEFFDITNFSWRDDFNGKIQSSDWLNERLRLPDTNDRFCNRQFSRYLLCEKATDLYNEVARMISSSIRGLSASAEININVISGLSGNTGGGCFIDVCYIVRQALYNLGLQEGACINGFFFMPDVNLANPGFPSGGTNEKILKRNGFAALKELDYLMNIPKNGDVFKQKYSDVFEIEQAHPPVDMCFLVSSHSSDEYSIPNGYLYAMNTVSEFILNSVSSSKIEDSFEIGRSNNFKALRANISALRSFTSKDYGANYNYNALGISCVRVPYKAIATYTATKFFDSIKYIQKKRPTKSDVEQMCYNIGLSFTKLDAKIRENAHDLNLDSNSFLTEELQLAHAGSISSSLASWCDMWQKEYENVVKSNIDMLGRSLIEYKTNNSTESVIGKIFNELSCSLNNDNLGAYYAACMIRADNNYTLSSAIEEIMNQVETKRNAVLNLRTIKMIDETNALEALRLSEEDQIAENKDAYLSMVKERYENQVEIFTYDAFLGLINIIKKQVEEIEINYFKKLANVMDRLFATFEDNAEYFEANALGSLMHSKSIIDEERVKKEINNVIKELSESDDNGETVAPGLVRKFIALMLSNYDKWNNENALAELIAEFINVEFGDIVYKPMKQYLQEKASASGDSLINYMSRDVIRHGLVDNCLPAFYYNPMLLDISYFAFKHAEYTVLSMPYGEDEFKMAANKSAEEITPSANFAIASNGFKDRIFLETLFIGIPLIAYKNITDLERVYHDAITPGLHLYERETKNWRDLPSPIPATFASSFYERPDKAKIDAIIDLYDRALSEKLIVEKIDEMCANVYAAECYDIVELLGEAFSADALNSLEEIEHSDIKQKSDKVESFIKSNECFANVHNVERALKKINGILCNYKETYTEVAKLTAYNRYEMNGKYTNSFNASLVDDFVMTPIIVNIVKNEIRKIDTLYSIQNALSEIQALLIKQNSIKDTFFKALLYSIIYRRRSNYVFDIKNSESTDTIILTDENEAYENIIVYNAFLKFASLNEDIVEQIKARVSNASVAITDEMYEKAVEYFEFYKSVYSDYKEEARCFVECTEISAFLDELYNRLDRFIRENQ